MELENNFGRIEPTFGKIVTAVVKGTGMDMRDYCADSAHEETHNARRMARGDKINTNLRNLVASENVELKPFKRGTWEGRILVDRTNKITITVSTKKTFKAIRKSADRPFPHYLMTIIQIENIGVESRYIQLDLPFDDISRFSTETYEKDYFDIFQGTVAPQDGYRHWIILYEATDFEVTDIQAILLDSNWAIAEQHSLNKFLVPDVNDLTVEPDAHTPLVSDAHTLVKVKAELKKEEQPTTPQIQIVKAREQKGEVRA